MPRTPRIPVLLLSLVPGCYSPNDDVIASDGGGGSSEGSADSTGGTTASGGMTGPGTTDPMGDTTSADPSASTGEVSDTEGDTTGGAPVCGNGEVEGDEVCDDGVNDGGYGGCTANCMNLGPHCGDDQVQGDEVCDDGNDVNADGCNIDCVESGSVVWTRTFDGPGHATDQGFGVAVYSDDAIVVVGRESTSADDYRGWVRKYDAGGIEEWTRSYLEGVDYTSFARGVAVGPDDLTLVCGSSYLNPESTVWARAYDADGGEGWTHLYNSPGVGGDACNAVAFDDAGNAILSGYRDGSGTGSDIWVRMLSAGMADELWTRTFDFVDLPDQARGAAYSDSDDAFVVVGHQGMPGSGSDAWVTKYDAVGGTEWSRTNSAGAYDGARGVAVDGAGNVFVVGNEDGPQPEGWSLWLAKYNADGSLLWELTEEFGSDPFLLDVGDGVATDADGNVIVAGSATGETTEAWVGKYDGEGERLWAIRPHEDIGEVTESAARGVAVDSQGDIIVVGDERRPDDGGVNIWVSKFTP